MSLNKFLHNHKSSNGSPITHTSFIGGKYTIPHDKYTQFQQLYFDNLNSDNFLIERNSKTYKFFADIDFSDDVLNEKITPTIIQNLVSLYSTVLETSDIIVSIRNFNKIHINFPSIHVNPSSALEFRQKIIDKCKETFPTLLKNTSDWDTVIDKSVYKNGGLRMYGSFKNKDEKSSYKLYDPKTNTYPPITFELFQKTCIRINNSQFINETILLEPVEDSEKDSIVKSFINSHKDELYDVSLSVTKLNYVGETLVCASLSNKICPFVSREHKRTANNINTNSPLYIVINQKGMSLRCHNEECKSLQKPTKNIPLSDDILTLFGSKLNIDSKLYPFFIKSLSRTHYDVAKLIYELYKNKYMIEGVRNGDEWYEYDGTRWIKSFNLWNIISEDFVSHFSIFNTEENSGFVEKLIRELKTVGFKSSLLKECGFIFNASDPFFSKRLDENPQLMCFNNGVLDLSNGKAIFRQGQRSDYLTLSTEINYLDYDPDHPKTKEVELFLSQVFVDTDVRDYVLKVIASSLFGGSDEHFHIWSGVGSNSKSTLIQLIEKTFGEYSCKMPISLLTQKRNGSANASPEVIRTKGRRFVSMQEPENGDDLKVGLLKELTGRDKIVARELYKNSVEFLPQFKIFLCCNDLPVISADDNGTWRRLRVVEFKSKFIDKPDPSNPYEFSKDRTLHLKLDTWPEHFMSILVHHYNQTVTSGIIEPDCVMKYTNQYKHDNDILELFIDSTLSTNPTSHTPLLDIWNKYIDWCRESGVKSISRIEFNKKFKKKHKETTKKGVKGFPFKFIHEDYLDE